MTGTDGWETVEEGTRSLEVPEVLCREQRVKDDNICGTRLLTREREMRTKVFEDWMYPQTIRTGKSRP